MVDNPAKFSPQIITAIAMSIGHWYDAFDNLLVLDIFAGTGRIAWLLSFFPNAHIIANELEPEWACEAAAQGCQANIGDASRLAYAADSIPIIATSPTFGNRMADGKPAVSQDHSRRYTYAHTLGRALHQQNTGQLHWGPAYRVFHYQVWREAWRVLCPGGLLIIDMKDHIRVGQRQYVTLWHKFALLRLGFEYCFEYQVDQNGMGNGQNAQTRVDYHTVLTFQKPIWQTV